jgi:anthranilate phosphoribosyltransferase
MVVHGGGLDEIALHAPTTVAELKDGEVRTFELRPEMAGLSPAPLSAIRGGDVERNTALTREVLEGAPGPRRDIVLLNAAAALIVAGQATELEQGVAIAARAIDTGAARSIVERLRTIAPVENQGESTWTSSNVS